MGRYLPGLRKQAPDREDRTSKAWDSLHCAREGKFSVGYTSRGSEAEEGVEAGDWEKV